MFAGSVEVHTESQTTEKEKADNNNWFFNFPAFAASLAASDVATSRVPQNLKDPHAQTVIERREPYGVRKYARRA